MATHAGGTLAAQFHDSTNKPLNLLDPRDIGGLMQSGESDRRIYCFVKRCGQVFGSGFGFGKLTVFEVTVLAAEDYWMGATTLKVSDIQEAILVYLRQSPSLSRVELADKIQGITPDGIKYHLDKLKEMGVIERIGGRKNGY